MTNRGNVNLSHTDNRLTGSVDGVHVDVDIPRGHSTATGSFAGFELSATGNRAATTRTTPMWRAHSRGVSPATISPSRECSTSTRTMPSKRPRSPGTSPGNPSSALDGGLSDTTTVGLVGDFAGSAFDLAATISSDLSGRMVRGRVGDEAVQLDSLVALNRRSIRIAGDCQGPPAVLAVVVGVFLLVTTAAD
jgi:hypothetical protein